MKRAALILLALCGTARAQLAPQQWSADQDAQNFICADVGYFQANNLTGVGNRCLEADGTGKVVVAGSGVACGAGGGGVTSVTGTALRVSATPTTGAVVVDTIGGFYSGATSGGNQDLGALSSGELLLSVSGGVASMSTVTPYQVEVNNSDTGPDYLANKLSGISPIVTTATTIPLAPSTVSGLVLWLKADAGVTVGSGTVSAWADQSGLSNNVSAPSTQPTFTASCINGLPCVVFNGSSTYLNNTTTNLLPAGNARSIYMLGTYSSSAAGGTPLAFRRGGSWFPMILGIGGTFYVTSYGSTNFTITDPAVTNVPEVFNLNYQSSTVTFVLSGTNEPVSGASTLLNDNGTTGFTIGQREGIGQFFAGEMTELLVFDHVLSGIDDNTIRYYLGQRGGISTGATPTGISVVQISDSTAYSGGLVNTTGTVTLANASTCPALQAVGGSTTAGLTCDPIVGLAANGNAYFDALGDLGEDAANWGWNDSTHVVNINGDFLATNISAPSTPAAGHTAIYVNGSTLNIEAKNSSGGINHGIQDKTCGASTWMASVANTGTSTCTQPSFADLSGSATCAQLPALTGGVTTSAGTCATKVVAITETSGPTSLTIGAIPDDNPSADVLVRPSGASTVVGVAANALAVSEHLAYYFETNTLAQTNWIATSSLSGGFGAGVDYTCDHVAKNATLSVVLASNGITSGTFTLVVDRNFSGFSSPLVINFTSASAVGVYTATSATGSSSASDTYGLSINGLAGSAAGTGIHFSAVVTLN